MEPTQDDKVILKKIDDLFHSVKVLFGKAEDALKFPHESIWKNDTIEYLTNAKKKYTETIQSVPEFATLKSAVEEQFNTRYDKIQAGYSQKLHSVELDKIASLIKNSMDQAERAVEQPHPNQYKNDSMEYYTKAKDAAKALEENEKFVGIPSRDDMLSKFKAREEKFLAAYSAKLYKKELEDSDYPIKNNMDQADRAVDQPHPNQYKNDSMEYYGKAKAAAKALEEKEHLAALPARNDILAKFKVREEKFLAAYSAKVYKKELEELEYPIKNNMDQADRAVDQPHPNQYKNDSMEYYGKAKAAVKLLEEKEHLAALPARDDILAKFKVRAEKFLNAYSAKVYKKELEDLEFPIKNNMDQADRAVDQPHPNQYKNDSMEYYGKAKAAAKVLEENENLVSVPGRDDILAKFQARAEKFLAAYSAKVYKKEFEELEYPIKHNMDQAERAVEQPHPNQYKNDSMEYFGLARTALSTFQANENISSLPGYQDVLDKFKLRSKAFMEKYTNVVYSKELDQSTHTIKMTLDKMDSAVESNHENIYTNDSMEYYGTCKSLLAELEANTNFIGLKGRDDQLVAFKTRLTDFLPKYSTKVYSKLMEKSVYHLKNLLDKATTAIESNHENIYKNDSMEYIASLRSTLKEFQSDSTFEGLKGRDEIIDKVVNELPNLLIKYRIKVSSKEMEKDVFHIKNNFDKAESELKENTEQRYKEASMEYLALARTALKQFESKDEYMGLTGRDELIEKSKERVLKFLNEYQTKVYTKDLEKELFSIKSQLDKAFQSLNSNSQTVRTQDSMEYIAKAMELYKQFESNTTYIGIGARDDMIVKFNQEYDRFQTEYSDSVLAQDVESISYKVLNSLRQANEALNSNHESIYTNDAMEYFSLAKSEYSAFKANTILTKEKKHAPRLMQEFEKNSSKFLNDYRVKVYAKALEKEIFPIKQLLNDAESTFQKGPPKQWWTEALEKMVKAKELIREFEKREEFKSNVEREELLADFDTRYGAFLKRYSEVALADEFKEEKNVINSAIGDAESTFKKGPPKQWWTEAIEKMAKAKDLVRSFEDKSIYIGLADRDLFLESTNKKIVDFYQLYATVALAQDLKDEIAKLKSKFQQAETIFKKGPPKQYWTESLELVIKVKQEFKEFQQNATYTGLKVRDEFVEEFEKSISEFGEQYSTKVFASELREAIDPIKSKLADAEETFKKAPPKPWYHESLTKAVDAKQLFKAFEDRQDFVGIKEREEFVEAFGKRMGDFISNYNSAVVQQDVNEEINQLKSEFTSAETTFKKGPPREWFELGLEQMVAVRNKFKEFESKSEYIGVGQRDAFVVETRARIEQFTADYNQAVFANELKSQITEIKSLVDDAEATFKKGPPRVWFDLALEKMIQARSLYNERMKDRTEFKGTKAFQEFTSEYETRYEAFKKNYADAVYLNDVKQAIYEIDSKITEGENIFRKGPPRQYWDEGMALIRSVQQSLISDFESKEEYLGIGDRDSFLKSIKERIRVVEKEYNGKVFLSEITQAIDSIKSKLSQSEQLFKQGPPRQFWDQSFENLVKLNEEFKSFESNQNYSSVEIRDLFVQEYKKRSTSLDSEYKEKVVGHQMRNDIAAIKSKLDQSLQVRSRGPIREFWDDALLKMVDAKRLFVELEANTLYNGIPQVEEFKLSFNKQIQEFEKLYQEKYGHEASELKSVEAPSKEEGGSSSPVSAGGVPVAPLPGQKPSSVVLPTDGTKVLYEPFAVGIEKIIPNISVSMDTPPALISISGNYNTLVKKIATTISKIRQLIELPPSNKLRVNIMKPDANIGQHKLDSLFQSVASFSNYDVAELPKTVQLLEKQINDIKNGPAKEHNFVKELDVKLNEFKEKLELAKDNLKERYDYIVSLLQVSHRVKWISCLRNVSSASDRKGVYDTFIVQRNIDSYSFLSFNYQDKHNFSHQLKIKQEKISEIMNEKISFVKIQIKDLVEKYGAFPNEKEILKKLNEFESQVAMSLLRMTKIKLVLANDTEKARLQRMVESLEVAASKVEKEVTPINVGPNSGYPLRGFRRDPKWNESVNANYNHSILFDTYEIPKYLTQADADRCKKLFVLGVDEIHAAVFLPEPLKCYPLGVWNLGSEKGQVLYGTDGIYSQRSPQDRHNPRIQVALTVNGKPIVTSGDSGHQLFTKNAFEIYNDQRSYHISLCLKRRNDPVSLAFIKHIKELGVGVHSVECKFNYSYENTTLNKKTSFDAAQPDFDIEFTTMATASFDIAVLENVNDCYEPIPTGLQSLTNKPYRTTFETPDKTWDNCNTSHVGRIVFGSDKLQPIITAAEATKVSDSFMYSCHHVFARMILPTTLNNFPIGIWKEGPLKGQPFYPKEFIKPGFKFETLDPKIQILLTIDGKPIQRTKFEDAFYTFSAPKVYNNKKTFGFYVLNKHGLQDVNNEKRILPGIFAHHILNSGVGDHTVKIEARYCITQTEHNKTAVEKDFPNTDVVYSSIIANGEFKINVPKNVTKGDFLQSPIEMNHFEDLKIIAHYFKNHPKFGGASPPKEFFSIKRVKDYHPVRWTTPVKRTTYRDDYGREFTVTKELDDVPSALAIDVQIHFFLSAANGWDETTIERYTFKLCNDKPTPGFNDIEIMESFTKVHPYPPIVLPLDALTKRLGYEPKLDDKVKY